MALSAILLIILSVHASGSPLHEISPPGITENRNLSLYDQGGSLDCRGVTTEDPKIAYKRLSTKVQQAREFILGHFQRKERAYIRLTENSVDMTSTSHIFIEPDERDSTGKWRIVWRIARAGRRGTIDDVPVIKSLQAVKTDRGMKLNFIDSDGKVVESLGVPYVIGYSYPD